MPTDGIRGNHAAPGKQEQNGCIEIYDRLVRYYWLAQFIFSSIADFPGFPTGCLWTYNSERPKMALGGIKPKIKSAMEA